MNQEKQTARPTDASITEKSAAEHAPPRRLAEKQQLLKARARELALNGEKEKPVGECIEVVEFLLAYE
jgi:hypothetical protein